ncbi:hypothetical protein [Butyrivibrio proteoclasticus]|uniref:hypothetical protein n=1 Tax=Butyrivibrio proteoclasticus TaxID=43305 RepID=UPI00047E5197|nr:hypothetical protein [Butyrivibrio proteoclasticus]
MNIFQKAITEIDERTGLSNDENVIESPDDKDIIDYSPNGKKLMTVTLSRKKWVNKVLKYAEQYPNEVTIKHINMDGSIVAFVPVDYLKISRPPKLSDEEKKRRTEILQRFKAE